MLADHQASWKIVSDRKAWIAAEHFRNGIILTVTIGPASSHLEFFTYSFRAMGSPCTFRLFSDSAWTAELVASLAADEVHRIETKYSLFSPTSFLAQINRVADLGGSIVLDTESAGLYEFAFACFHKSCGLFDITSGLLRRAYDFSTHSVRREVPLAPLMARVGMDKIIWKPPILQFPLPGMRLDFGGVAKEYAADRVAAIFASYQISSALIDLGGDMVATGALPDGSAWRIGIRDPSEKSEMVASVLLAKGALTTSGDYESYIEIDGKRHSHIINPKTGLPTAAVMSVTGLASNCMAAGAATTIAMLHGDSAADWLQTQNIPFLALMAGGKQINALPLGAYGKA